MFRRTVLTVGMVLVLFVGLRPRVAAAQPATQPSQPAQRQDVQGMQDQGMRQMSEAVTSMAQMCKMMMRREAAALPYVAWGLGIVGALLAIALILFIVLEVQWIRFFGVRIRTERSKLTHASIERR